MHIFILGLASIVSVTAEVIIFRIDASRLASFGPTAQIYFSGIKNGLINAIIILSVPEVRIV